MLFAIQIKKGLRYGQKLYVATLIKIKADQLVKIPNAMIEILKEFKDPI